MNTVETKWAAVEIEIAPDQEELAGWLLMQIAGAIGCEIKPLKDDRILLRATFDSLAVDVAQLTALLAEYGLGGSVASLRTESIAQEDWLAKWKEHFKPFLVGNRLVISPPWELDAAHELAGSERRLVVIDPGMAFGTGLHATTQFCLRCLETERLGPFLLDVGTGSGILALAAVALNEDAEVTGIDNDPVAVEMAQRNHVLNSSGGRIEFLVGTTLLLTGRKFDDILSNITCEDIVALLPEYIQLLNPGGSVICAGVLGEKRELLEKAVQGSGFVIERTEIEGTWCGLILRALT